MCHVGAVMQTAKSVWTLVDRDGYFEMSYASLSGRDGTGIFYPLIIDHRKLQPGQML